MGKVALLSTIGFTIIMSRMLVSSNEKSITLSERSTEYYEKTIARNIALSGAQIGMAKYFKDPTWLAGFSHTSFENGDFSVTLTKVSNRVQIVSTGNYSAKQRSIQTLVGVRPPLADFAMFVRGDITDVVALNEEGNPDTSIVAQNQEFMFDMYDQTLIDMATNQGHVHTDSTFRPANEYPDDDFYSTGSIPNVTHVLGDMRVLGGRTIYGIFVVEGNVELVGTANIEGVLYMKGESSVIAHLHGGGSPTNSTISGGVLSNGHVQGNGNHIIIQHEKQYMQDFADNGDTAESLLVYSWQEL